MEPSGKLIRLSCTPRSCFLRKKERGRRFVTLIFKTEVEHLRRYLEAEHGEEAYVKYAKLVLEPKRIKTAPELADSIEKQGIVVSNLAAEVKKLRQRNAELSKFKDSIESRLEQFAKAEQYIAEMQKQMKFYEEGGVVISYTDEISKEEITELIAELKKRRSL